MIIVFLVSDKWIGFKNYRYLYRCVNMMTCLNNMTHNTIQRLVVGSTSEHVMSSAPCTSVAVTILSPEFKEKASYRPINFTQSYPLFNPVKGIYLCYLSLFLTR